MAAMEDGKIDVDVKFKREHGKKNARQKLLMFQIKVKVV